MDISKLAYGKLLTMNSIGVVRGIGSSNVKYNKYYKIEYNIYAIHIK